MIGRLRSRKKCNNGKENQKKNKKKNKTKQRAKKLNVND